MSRYGDVTQQQKVTALRLFIEFEDIAPRKVAEQLGLTEVQVEEIQKRHGYPDPTRMRMSADMMERALEATAGPSEPRRARLVPEPQTARPSVAAPRPLVASDLVREARASGDKRLGQLAERFDMARKKLVLALQEWRSNEAERRAAAEAKAARDAEIANLEARLAELRGQAKPEPKAKRAASTGSYPCDHEDCDFVSVASQGLASHKRMAHAGWTLGPDGWRKPDDETDRPERTEP